MERRPLEYGSSFQLSFLACTLIMAFGSGLVSIFNRRKIVGRAKILLSRVCRLACVVHRGSAGASPSQIEKPARPGVRVTSPQFVPNLRYHAIFLDFPL